MRDLGDGSIRTFTQNNPDGAVVMITANWCGDPCESLVPILELIAAENPHVAFARADLNQNREFAAEMGITGIPTILGLINGECVCRSSFPRDKATIEAELEKVLSRAVS